MNQLAILSMMEPSAEDGLGHAFGGEQHCATDRCGDSRRILWSQRARHIVDRLGMVERWDSAPRERGYCSNRCTPRDIENRVHGHFGASRVKWGGAGLEGR